MVAKISPGARASFSVAAGALNLAEAWIIAVCHKGCACSSGNAAMQATKRRHTIFLAVNA